MAHKQDPKDIAPCPRCRTSVGAQCVSIELRKRNRGKLLQRSHPERYAVASTLIVPTAKPKAKHPKGKAPKRQRAARAPKNSTTFERTNNNVTEVIELGTLCNGFSPVPLIVGGRVVDVPMERVFGLAELVAPTLLSPPSSLSTLTHAHHRSFLARVRCGDVAARSQYLALFSDGVNAATDAMVEVVRGEVVVEDVLSEVRFGVFDALCRWDEKGPLHGYMETILSELPKTLATRMAGREKWWGERFADKKADNVRQVVSAGEAYGISALPLIFMGKVVDADADLGKSVTIARAIATTLGRKLKYEELTLEHELSYTTRFGLGDVAAAWEYIHINHTLVVKLVKKACLMLPINDLGKDDLINEGRFGAFEGFKRWDPTRGRFSTYSYMWILQHLQGKAARGGSTISVRPELHLALFKAKAEGRDLSETEAALERVRVLSSIDEPMGDKDGKPMSRAHVLTADQDVFKEVANADAKSKLCASVHNALDVLDERQRFIIVNRMFGSGDAQLTLEEIGQQMNISRERVRQIETSAHKKIREHVRREFGGTHNVLEAMA